MWLKITILALTCGVVRAASFIPSPDSSENSHTLEDCNTRLAIPLLEGGSKYFYLGLFFKLNWYQAAQFCNYHGMNFASITSKEQNDAIIESLINQGITDEKFWISGTDLGKEGSFSWLANGQPFEFQDWSANEPDNKDGNENCLQLWNLNLPGSKWNDVPCAREYYFICDITYEEGSEY